MLTSWRSCDSDLCYHEQKLNLAKTARKRFYFSDSSFTGWLKAGLRTRDSWYLPEVTMNKNTHVLCLCPQTDMPNWEAHCYTLCGWWVVPSLFLGSRSSLTAVITPTIPRSPLSPPYLLPFLDDFLCTRFHVMHLISLKTQVNSRRWWCNWCSFYK